MGLNCFLRNMQVSDLSSADRSRSQHTVDALDDRLNVSGMDRLLRLLSIVSFLDCMPAVLHLIILMLDECIILSFSFTALVVNLRTCKTSFLTYHIFQTITHSFV